jgi:large subunit ribosomal protein L30
MNKVKVTQVKSGIGCPRNQRETLQRLGLRGVHKSHVLDDSASVRGMIYKVRHLITVESVEAVS